MKKIIFIALITLTSTMSFAQNFSELANSEFKSKESFKSAESQVLTCANYLFTTPTNQAELNRLNAMKYIMKWMEGTPDYTFELGEKVLKLTNEDTNLLSLYMAAMSKVVLENTAGKLNSDEIYNQSEKILVKYCAGADNKIKPSKKIKQLIKEME
jgi:hypothetical protein